MRSWFSFRSLVFLVLTSAAFQGCSSSPPPPAQPVSGSADGRFEGIAHEYLEDLYRRQPTQATYLGIHKYDDRLEDYSRQAVTDAVAAARQFRDRVAAIDAASLSADRQLDREQLLHAIDSRVITLDVIRPWAKDADTLQQRPDQHGVHHDQARVRARRRAAAAVDRARESHAGRAGRGAQEPREPAPDLHADRDRSARRQPRVLPDGGDGGVCGRQGHGAPRGVQARERRRHRRARRLQEVAAGRSAEAIDRRVRDWRRHVSQEARRPTR